MIRQWSELTAEEQWKQAKAEAAIKRKYARETEAAETAHEDGVLFAIAEVRAKIKAEINILRREAGIVEL